MARTKLTQAHKDELRAVALARHAARREAGLPAPTGQPYNASVAEVAPVADAAPVAVAVTAPVVVPRPAPRAPLVILRDDGTVAPPKPVPVVPEVPRPPVDPAPRLAFQAWLGGPVGRGASDPRMSSSPSRMAAELEHALWLAFQAGQAVGVVTTEEGL